MSEKITLARPYAKAIFESANEHDTVQKWSDALMVLSEVSKSDKVIDIVNNPETSADEAVSLYTAVCKDFLDDNISNLIQLSAENGRLTLFPEIALEFENLSAEAHGTIEAEVVSAYAVNTTQKKMITEKLEKRFNKKVSITTSVDKSLLGGIIIRAGDLVIDGSVSNQLQKITHTLMR